MESTENNKITVNIILMNDDLKRFSELKQHIGVGKPNTEIIRRCIDETHKLLVK